MWVPARFLFLRPGHPRVLPEPREAAVEPHDLASGVRELGEVHGIEPGSRKRQRAGGERYLPHPPPFPARHPHRRAASPESGGAAQLGSHLLRAAAAHRQYQAVCAMAVPRPSWSRSVTETVRGSHQYTLKGFSLAKGIGPGRHLSSDTFAVGGYDWAVYVYPDGKNHEDNASYVSVFVALASEGTDVRALFELTLLDQSGRARHKVHSHFDRSMQAGPYTLKYRGSMWGYKRFFRRTQLETSDFLKDDCLVMNCTVGVVKNHLETPKNIQIDVPPSDIGRCFKDLLKLRIGCDITFEVGDEQVQAHKWILATRSPVFKAQFFGPIGKADLDRVVVEDVEPIVFKAMVNFIYSDELPGIHELAGSFSMWTSTAVIQHLLAAADRYGLDRLRILCEAKLCDELTSETVATTLALAEQHHCAQLKSACLKFTAVRQNLGAVMVTEGFNYLEETCPSLLSDLLATVAVVDDDPASSVNRKRGVSNNEDANPVETVEASDRRTRRRV